MPLTGLWNHLAEHQSGTKPFRLLRWAVGVDLKRLCQTRTEELEGFIEGLFGDEEGSIFPSAPAKPWDASGRLTP